MSDWIHNLPVPSMALVIFGFTYLLAAGIFAAVSALATEGRAKSFKGTSNNDDFVVRYPATVA
jgi:hypothetical protein